MYFCEWKLTQGLKKEQNFNCVKQDSLDPEYKGWVQ